MEELKTILVVDDEDSFHENIELRYGLKYKIIAAYNEQEAKGFILKNEKDLSIAFLDLQLNPNEKNFMSCSILLGLLKENKIPAVIISNYNSATLSRQLRELGAKDYLAKSDLSSNPELFNNLIEQHARTIKKKDEENFNICKETEIVNTSTESVGDVGSIPSKVKTIYPSIGTLSDFDKKRILATLVVTSILTAIYFQFQPYFGLPYLPFFGVLLSFLLGAGVIIFLFWKNPEGRYFRAFWGLVILLFGINTVFPTFRFFYNERGSGTQTLFEFLTQNQEWFGLSIGGAICMYLLYLDDKSRSKS